MVILKHLQLCSVLMQVLLTNKSCKSTIFCRAPSRSFMYFVKTSKKVISNQPWFVALCNACGTLIDVIFTSHPDNVSCSGVSHVGISDHSLIYVFRKISLPSAVRGNNTVSYRQFKNFNRNRFRSDILAQPWADFMGMDNPNEMWSKWKALFLEVCDLHAPLHTKYVSASKSP